MAEEQPQRIPPAPPPVRPREEAPAGDVNIRTLESDLEGAPPETVNQLPEDAAVEAPSDGGRKKKILIIAAIVSGVVVLGLIGYFVVYPLVSPIKEAPPVVQPEPVASAPAAREHTSYFIESPTAISRVNLPNITALSIAFALQNEGARAIAPGSLVEVVMLDSAGNQAELAAYLPQLSSTVPGEKLGAWFESDFTAFIYFDDQGAWPGYVIKVKEGANVDELKAGMSQLENGDISAFYIAPPGVLGQFKDGKVPSTSSGQVIATRYAAGSRAGAAFNYGYAGDYLLISTSYNGLKAALPLLGL